VAEPKDTDAVLIAGPTASGKSAVALGLAERLDGVIINADSMQVYQDLRIVTARPSEDDEARLPHALYGFVDVAQSFSAGMWAEAVRKAINAAREAGKLPLIVGGTGLYFSVLTEGLSPIPDVPDEVRRSVRQRLETDGLQALQQAVAACDPEAAVRIDPQDGQRLGRALEVFEATGEPLTSWQKRPRQPVLQGNFAKVVLEPDRAVLYQRCDERCGWMVAHGALDEVETLAARGLDRTLPVMKALGVPELMAYLAGEMELEAASERAKMRTRRYAKRQVTWFRNQMIAWNAVSEQQLERKIEKILALICD